MGKPLYDEQLRHEQELRKVTERLTRRATRLQAHEYARRLSELNGEAARIRAILGETVSREKFDDFKDTHDRDLKALGAQLDQARGALNVARFLGIAGIVGLIVGLYSVFGPH